MRKVTPMTEQFQRFGKELKESFWGDLYGYTKLLWKKALEEESARLREVYWGANLTSGPGRRRGIAAMGFIFEIS